MTPEDRKLAQAALLSQYCAGSLDGDTFLALSDVLNDEPEEFWQRYLETFNPPSATAYAIVKRLAEEASEELAKMIIRS